MKTRSFTFLFAGIFALTLTGIGWLGSLPVAQAQGAAPQTEAANWPQPFYRSLVFDVATDARTLRLNRGASLPEAKRGDTFIVEGKIYPGGTLPVGGTLAAPGPFNPDGDTKSIGKWVLRGTFNYDFGEIIAGAEPAVFGTQYFLFEDGRMLVTEGSHAGSTTQLRAVLGGGGAFSQATGDVREQLLGTNLTGLFNQRFTFRLKIAR
jgi:hypothetical protein